MSAYEVVQMAITGELCNPGFRLLHTMVYYISVHNILVSFYAEYVNCCHFGLFFVSVCENTPIRRVIFTKMAMSILMHEHINSTILAKVGNAGTKCVLNMIYLEILHIVLKYL